MTSDGRSRFTTRHALAAVLGVIVSCPWTVHAAERQLFMSVMLSGQPVLGLTTADVRLEQAGAECAVTSVEPDTPMMKIALLVDTSGPAAESVNPLREGLGNFLDTLPPQHEIGLFTITGQTRRRVDFTTDRDELREGVGNLFGERNTGAALLDGLLETLDRRFEDEDPWPVFVLVIHDGAEVSRGVQDREFTQFVTDLVARGATVHAVLVSTSGGGLQTQVAINLTSNTGGIYNSIGIGTALPRALTELAAVMGEHHDQVKDRYRVLFDCDPADSAEGISVSVAGAAGQAVGLYFDRRVDR